MKASELVRWLRAEGVTLEHGKRHLIATLGRRRTTIPRHGAQEIRTGTARSILRDLGLLDRWREKGGSS